MANNRDRSQGFTLIAALLLTVLLSGIAVGLLYLVSNESRMGGNDLEANMAYYGAEAGIENMTALLAQTYQTTQNPTASTITALTTSSNYPTAVSGSNISNIAYTESITWPYSNAAGNPAGQWDIVGAGSNQGMVATIIPYNLTVTATRTGTSGQVGSNSAAAATGASVTMTRTVEIAELPAFEFGIFCDGDCDYFAGPPFNFGGRVHTNRNLFLASNTGPLTFTDKIAAVGQVVLDQLENGQSAGSGSGSYNGAIYIPSAAGACPPAPASGPATSCTNLTVGSWTGGFPGYAGSANPGWASASGAFNQFILNGTTGAKKLQLPFVQSSRVGAIDIIRKPTPVDTPDLYNARLYSKASIRILLADTQADLYPGETRTDSATQDIQIGTPFTNNSGNAYYTVATAAPGVTAGNMYFATAQKQSFGSNNWTANAPTGCSNTLNNWPLHGQVTGATKCTGVWLRVEYLNASGNWVGVTRQWLSYGFGRNYNEPPTHPYNSSTGTAPLCNNFPTYPAGQCQNGISPAILILQQLAPTKTVANGMGASAQQFVWLPLNFYDAREGEPRDTRPAGDTGVNCSPNGIMNAVELDAGNLWLWLKGAAPYGGGSGPLVNALPYNGYILYFADHRGMLADPHPLTTFYSFSGMSGLGDVVNSSSSVGVPDNALEPMTYYAAVSSTNPIAFSPEDVAVKGAGINLGLVDRFGYANLGAGFGISSGNMAQPYYIQGSVTTNAIQCLSYTVSSSGTPAYISSITPTYGVPTAEWNMVTGPRHVLRIVDGGMDSAGNSYVPPTNGVVSVNGNGFTITSEEPVYVLGDYNTGVADPFWPSENTITTPHSAAAIIADSVTLLSNPPAGNNMQGTSAAANVGWSDFESFAYPAVANSRPGNNTYYRMAIAAGKNVPFPKPTWGGADMGTDGGMHNFLRYLENRGANNSTVNYAGSMISMYYSQYDTGIFKCCNAVYGAPKRNYFFDTLFLNPANLPPGTPMFQDVVNLSYHESYAAQ